MKRESLKVFLLTHKRFLFSAFIFASIVLSVFTPQLADLVKASFGSPGDSSLIHACKDNRGRLVQIDAGASCNSGETLVTWLKDVDAGSGLNITRNSSGATISLANANNDGWTSTNETWTYASTTSFTVSGDQTAKYAKGTRLKFTQTSVKYAVVVSSTYSSPNTTVNILQNNDYSIANASITSPHYSYQASPQGYPTFFNFSTSTSTSGTAYTNPPTINHAKISIIGTQAFVSMEWTYNANSGGSGNSRFTIPLTATPAYYHSGSGSMATSGKSLHVELLEGNVISASMYDATSAITNGWTGHLGITFEY